jgi:gluconolactonase
MRSKIMFAIACGSIGLVFTLPPAFAAQERFPQPKPAKEVMVKGIPGVVAAGAKWQLVWGGPDNADGLVGYEGGVLFAQEQPSYVGHLDEHGVYSVFYEGAQGAGAVAVTSDGRVIGVERTCTDPGMHPKECKVPTALTEFYPEYKVLTNNDGKGFGRVGDLVVNGKGGVYFNSREGVFFFSPSGEVSMVTDNPHTNGIMLSPDGKTFYATDGKALLAFDVEPDGMCKNERQFAMLHGGEGDGLAMDADGRLYVSSHGPGVQVFSAKGEYLGAIPTPRSVSSIAFSGPDKKTLYAKGAGAVEPNGAQYLSRDGVRNNAKSIYKIDMIAQGIMTRAK